MTSVSLWTWRLVVLAVTLGSIGVLLALVRQPGQWAHRLRSRLVFGLPIGTLLTVILLLTVYLFAQHGLTNWAEPTVLPFRAWSYEYPVGMLLAAFAHSGPNHIVGNLIGTITFGTLAEYAWSHFPTRRGQGTFTSLRTNPFARAVAFFGAVVFGGLLTASFSLGPIVGFSGVVFAFAGLAIVRFPLVSVVVILGADLVSLLYRALHSPETISTAGTQFVTPWFASIAIQGHYLGFLMGLAVGVVLVHRRDVVPSVGRLWFAALAFGAEQSLWALYAPRGEGSFVLLRAAGVAVILLLAALAAIAATSSGRTLVARIDLSGREAAVGLLLAVLVAVGLVAVPFNLLTVGATDPPDSSIEVRDYTVYYAEDVPHQLVSAINISVAGESSQVNVSGVIVTSPRRSVWWPEVTASELSARNRASIVLGGLGWRRVVHATRPTWQVVGGDATYKVYLKRSGAERRLAFRSAEATADAKIEGRNVSLVPTTAGFDVVVSRQNETLARGPLPTDNTTEEIGGLTFQREGPRLFAATTGTRIRIATRSDEGRVGNG